MERWHIEAHSPEIILDFIVAKGGSSGPIKVLCFDYFDTLTVRSVQPEHTKVLAAAVLSMLLDATITGQEIYIWRQKMERELCESNADAGHDLEFNLSDLARRFYRQFGKQTSRCLVGTSTRQFVDAVLSIELAVECAVQQVCMPVAGLLAAVHRHGLTTVLVSDFYLPERTFRRMLKFHGLETLIDHCYISADHGETKGSGKLYRRLIADVGCRPEQAMMIGDNPHADIKMAAQEGLKTLQVENPAQQAFYRKWKKAHRKDKKNVEFALPVQNGSCFPEMGTTLWLFTCRLFQKLNEKGVRDVFFFSKEGELLKRLFDDFQQQLFGAPVIRTHYLVVSRKATFIASLKPLEHENFSRLFNHYRDISLRDFMLSLNMEEEQARRICSRSGLDFEKRFPDLQSQDIFDRLLQTPSFQEEYRRLRLEQKTGFLTYLGSFNVDYEREGLFIVDVGWKGSIQDNIFHILGGRVPVQGFYVGSLIATELSDKNRKTGLLFSDRPSTSRFFHVYNNNRSLFEMMLGASHGSADGYMPLSALKSGSGKERQQQVYARINHDRHEVGVMVLDLPEERHLFEKMIKPLQQNIMKAAAGCTRQFLLNACRQPDEGWFSRRHARMVFRPTRREIDFFEKLYHLENFGVFEYTHFQRGRHASWEQRWANFKGVLLHPEVLESGVWPPIILRRMGVGLLRYYDGWRRSIAEFGLRW